MKQDNKQVKVILRERLDEAKPRRRGGREDRGGRVWRGAGGLPMVEGRSSKHALSWQTLELVLTGWLGSGRLVCALQTVVGETTINTRRVHECSEGARKKKTSRKSRGDNCEEKREQRAPPRHLEKAPKKKETILPFYPTPRRQPALSTLPTTSCHPSGLNCPPTPPGEPRPPIGNPRLTSVAIKRCALYFRGEYAFLTHSTTGGLHFSFSREQFRLWIWLGVYTFFILFKIF